MGKREIIWFVVKAELRIKRCQILVCSKKQVNFMIYGQTGNVSQIKNPKL